MSALGRFYFVVSFMTIAIMFVVLTYVFPAMQATAMPQLVASHVPGVTLGQVNTAWQAVLTFVLTFGFYRLIANALRALIGGTRLFRKLFLGPAYLEGTWIGRFDDGGRKIWSAEHFEQTLEGLVIIGRGVDATGQVFATWHSTSVSVDVTSGTLVYMYSCDEAAQSRPHQGIGVFQLDRSSPGAAPEGLSGYSADLVDGQRTWNDETKVSARLLPYDEALRLGRAAYP